MSFAPEHVLAQKAVFVGAESFYTAYLRTCLNGLVAAKARGGKPASAFVPVVKRGLGGKRAADIGRVFPGIAHTRPRKLRTDALTAGAVIDGDSIDISELLCRAVRQMQKRVQHICRSENLAVKLSDKARAHRGQKLKKAVHQLRRIAEGKAPQRFHCADIVLCVFADIVYHSYTSGQSMRISLRISLRSVNVSGRFVTSRSRAEGW